MTGDSHLTSDSRGEAVTPRAPNVAHPEGNGGAPSDAFARLAAWLVDGGAKMPHSRLGPAPLAGVGLIANKSIPAGALVVAVPGHLIMLAANHAPHAIVEHPAIAEARSSVPELHNGLPLMLALLHEAGKGEGSSFWPYLATLPESIELPMGYDEVTREALIGTSAADLLPRLDVVLRAADESIAAACASGVAGSVAECERTLSIESGKANRDRWSRVYWAFAIVRSRAMVKELGAIGRHAGGHAVALIPLLDALNHEFYRAPGGAPGVEVDHDTSWNERNGRLELRAWRRFRRGSEVLWEYGPKPNSLMLLSYGFAVDANPHDSVCIPLGVAAPQALQPDDDPAVGRRLELLAIASQHFGDAHEPVMPACLKLLPGRGSAVPLETLVRARILSRGADDVLLTKPSQRRVEELLSGRPLVPTAREMAAHRLLLAAAENALGRFVSHGGDSSAAWAEDDALLAADRNGSAPLPAPLRMAVMVRRGERRILSDAIHTLGKDGIASSSSAANSMQ